MAVLEHSVRIEAAPEAVWRVWVDPTRIPEWQTGRPVIVDVRGAFGAPGSSYVARRGRLVARTTVVAAIPPRMLLTRTNAYFGLRFEVESHLEGRAGGTELRLRARTSGARRGLAPLVRLVERVVLSPAEARKELAAFKALLEADRP